jgi:hypothetical protein
MFFLFFVARFLMLRLPAGRRNLCTLRLECREFKQLKKSYHLAPSPNA